jgi:hypothetical protein
LKTGGLVLGCALSGVYPLEITGTTNFLKSLRFFVVVGHRPVNASVRITPHGNIDHELTMPPNFANVPERVSLFVKQTKTVSPGGYTVALTDQLV